MSQKAVEGLIGRLVTDRVFRQRFFGDPVGTCLNEGVDASARELQAVLTLEDGWLEDLSRRLDRKILRAAVPVEQLSEARGVKALPAGARKLRVAE